MEKAITMFNSFIPLLWSVSLLHKASYMLRISMASKRISIFSFLLVLLFWVPKISASDQQKFLFACSAKIHSCNALLYQKNSLQEDEIASLYSVNIAEIKTIKHGNKQDYLVPVNCSCKNVEWTDGYFYDVIYNPENNTSL